MACGLDVYLPSVAERLRHDGTKSDLLATPDRITLFCWSGIHADFLPTAQAYMVLPIQQIQQSGARAWRRTVRYNCIACLCIRTTGCDDSDAGTSRHAPAARHSVTDSDCLHQHIACCCHAWSHWATLSVSLPQLSCLQASPSFRSWSDERWWIGNRSYQELWLGQFFCSMPQRLRDAAQEAPEEEMVEVAVEPEEPTLLLGPLSAGSEAKITGGHHAHLIGAHVLILPSPDAHSRNVRLLVGSRAQKKRTFTIDIRNLEACSGSRAHADDGITPRLRWQLYPPPLTIYSAKFLLGWMSLDLLVPPAAPKRAPSGRWQEPPLPLELAEPWTAHRDPESGRTFYYNATTKDATWHKPREPLRLPLDDVELPEPWEAHRAQGTDWIFYYNKAHRAQGTDWIFYYNKVTGESTWDSPQMAPPSQPEPCADHDLAVGSNDGQVPADKAYSAAEVDDRGRLKPKPKRRPEQLRRAAQAPAGELPKDARLEILAGDLVLKSASAVSSTDSRSDSRQPVQTSASARPTQSVESPAASSRSTPTSATSTTAAPRRGVKRRSQTGVPPCDPRKRPPSIWFMEDDPDDTPAPPPKVKAKPKAKPRTAGANARTMSTLLKISRANRARAVAAAAETGAVDSPLPREPCSSVVLLDEVEVPATLSSLPPPGCRSVLSILGASLALVSISPWP
eukprot:s2461_g14.t2